MRLIRVKICLVGFSQNEEHSCSDFAEQKVYIMMNNQTEANTSLVRAKYEGNLRRMNSVYC